MSTNVIRLISRKSEMSISNELKHCNRIMSLEYVCVACGERTSAESVIEALREVQLVRDQLSGALSVKHHEVESLRAELDRERQLRMRLQTQLDDALIHAVEVKQ